MHVWGQRAYGKTVLSIQVCNELKTALKKKPIKKKRKKQKDLVSGLPGYWAAVTPG